MNLSVDVFVLTIRHPTAGLRTRRLISKTIWEGKGVKPDVEVPEERQDAAR
jgi:hypothetical protein